MESGDLAGLLVATFCCLVVGAIPVGLPAYALIMGFRRRKATERRLAEGEPRLEHLLQLSTEVPAHPGPTALVHGSVAYAADFPSRWATGWRNLVGGEALSLNDQVGLARRLATLRMLEHAASQGAVAVANVRVETSHIDMNSGSRGRQALIIDMLVYGTALLPASGGQPARPSPGPQPPPPPGGRP